ncbi:MAG TPA: HlyD family efflux transporter periplasmic adaptor subunit [Ideonella sp.]|uniref:efflux RND transporter periplasmic adaptor subunit n=1 Tax=Ideonella sp. TaxID=1929293 RepID=UPI002CAE382D|nr:HlyD family efflux transporter periplasmic adaptor subunit [Ideonella sp.]HSI52297.1 HlyD family efflux transporter periplasmic adaptor subunit [Ideonella sp.]
MIRDTAAQDRMLATELPARRRPLWWAAAGLLVVGAGLWLFGGKLAGMWREGSGGVASVSMSRLTLADVQRGPLVRDLAAEGKVVAAQSPTLYAPGTGTVTLKVHAGDAVQKGQVLASIDSPALASRVAQEQSQADALQADAKRAEVQLRQQRSVLQSAWENARIDAQTAENDLVRQQKAFEAGAASGMQVEHAKDTLDKARITLSHAKEGMGLNDDSLQFDLKAKQLAFERQRLMVTELQRQQSELQVRSPVDGQVGQLFVAERATVAQDAQLLSVIDLSALEVQMQVAESYARELSVGMPGEVAGNGKTWRAEVSAVSPEVVNNEVAARLRFVGEPPSALRQNQRLSVRVLLDKRDSVLTVRRGNFVEQLGGQFAYVVRDGVAIKQPVRLGARGIDQIEITQGLNVGDRVIVSGTDALQGAERVPLSP